MQCALGPPTTNAPTAIPVPGQNRAAGLDRAHHLQLCVAHMAAVGVAPSGAEVAEDVRDFQSGTLHDGAETTSPGSPWVVVALAYQAGSRPRAAPWLQRERSAVVSNFEWPSSHES